MSHETSQVAIQDRPLLSVDAQLGMGRWTEIGEAEVIQTIFGKAKVRIIRKHDQTRRRAWLLTALAVTTIGTAAWQSWLASQHVEPQQTADIPLPVSAKVQVSEPALQPETVAPPAATPSVESTPAMLPPAGISKAAISKESSPPQSAGSQADEPMAARLAKDRPSKTNKPQPAPLAADSSASVNQSDKLLQPKLAQPKQPPIAAVVATPPTAKQTIQHAASSTAAAAPLAVPPVKEDTSSQSSPRGQQPPLSIDSHGK